MKTSRFLGIIFDMDGTLTLPTLDFAAIRAELGMVRGDVAHHIAALPPAQQQAAWTIVERHEEDALLRMRLQPGAASLLNDCRTAGVRLGVVTRNTQRSVDMLCQNFGLRFDCALTRTFAFMKPHPGPVRHMLEVWGIPGAQALMVGDYLHDVECGRNAGTLTCFYQNPGYPDYGEKADYTVCSMAELHRVIFD
jgi:HAD superfamily hydrolase (TIGR01549 family)